MEFRKQIEKTFETNPKQNRKQFEKIEKNILNFFRKNNFEKQSKKLSKKSKKTFETNSKQKKFRKIRDSHFPRDNRYYE